MHQLTFDLNTNFLQYSFKKLNLLLKDCIFSQRGMTILFFFLRYDYSWLQLLIERFSLMYGLLELFPHKEPDYLTAVKYMSLE